jgi:hypothetical protein
VMQSNKNTVLNQQEIKDINFSQYKYYEIQQHTRNNWQYATCKINRLFGTQMCGLSSNVLILALVSRIELL